MTPSRHCWSRPWTSSRSAARPSSPGHRPHGRRQRRSTGRRGGLQAAGATSRPCRRRGRGRCHRRKRRRDRPHDPAGALRPDAAGQRPTAARSVRCPPGRPAGTPATGGQPAGNCAAGRKQHHAHLHPPRGLPRPPHPPGRDQTCRRRPPADRHPLHPGGATGAARHHRGMLRPAGRAGGQPAGHVPDHLRFRQPADQTGALVRGDPGRPPRRPRRTGCGWTCRPTCPRSTPTPECSNGSSRTSWRTPSNTHPIPTSSSSGPPAASAPQPCDGRPAGELRIIDHGQGVPAESVMECSGHSSASTTPRRPPASGSALAVAKGFTEAMGGTLTAEATPGGGLTMVIRLPLSTGTPFDGHPAQAPLEAQSLLAAPRSRTCPLRPARTDRMTAVLVVDDDPHMLRALRITLQAHGYTVTTAADGNSALLAATQNPLSTHRPGPGPARHGRHHVSSRSCAVEQRPDPGALRPARLRGQGQGPRRRRRRLRHQTLRTGRAPGPAAGRSSAGPSNRRTNRWSPPTPSPSTWPRAGSPATAQDVRLTPTEWGILEVLVRNPEKLITQQQLLTEVWGPAYAKETNYLRVYMAQLRRKLEPDTASPRHLLTEAGIGYRFLP